MLRKVLQFLLLSLVLLLVFLASALLAMRFAIHGREVQVPRLAGLTPAQAERLVNEEGLVLSVSGRFYSPQVAAGRIVSQVPAPNSTVRRGWKIFVSESLGPQHADIPNLVGESYHAAAINLGRRGLEIGRVATVHLPGAPPQIVVAQSPRPDSTDVSSPRVDLVLSAADNAQLYVMADFVGQHLAVAAKAIAAAGFKLGKLPANAYTADGDPSPAAIIFRQYPQAGQKVAAGSKIYFELKKEQTAKSSKNQGSSLFELDF
ncbi:MAG: PASTA domain-containing protein [Candidatus Angelobacter sp.]